MSPQPSERRRLSVIHGGPLALIACLAIVLSSSVSEGAERFTMKIGFATINDPQHEWAKRYKTRLEQRTADRIQVQIYPANQLGQPARLIEGVQLGTVEVWIGPPEFLLGVDARLQVLSAPYLFTDVDHADRVINDREFFPRFLSLAEPKGLKGINLFVYGPSSFVSRAPIRTPDDLRGKKVRVLASPIQTTMLAAVGATGVPMPPGEAMAALQQGAIDAMDSGLPVFTAFKFYDIVKYHSNTNHNFITSISVVSKKWFDALPPDLQKAVVEEGPALRAPLHDVAKSFYQAAETTWKEKTKDGWIDLPPTARDAFREKMTGAADRVAADVPGLKEWLELLRAKAKAYAR